MSEKPVNPWRTTLKRRLAVTGVLFALWVVVIQGRLIYLQVVASAWLTEEGNEQQVRLESIPGKRGTILDRRGQTLAVNVPAPTIEADPRLITDVERTIDHLCTALEDCSERARAELRTKLTKNTKYSVIRRQVPLEVASRIAALKKQKTLKKLLEGITLREGTRRYYPNKEMAAHVLGTVGGDKYEGQSGVEYLYNKKIQGQQGSATIFRDGRHSVFATRVDTAPTEGSTLELTLDENVQHIVERELRIGVEDNRANWGAAVVLEPESGEVLGMASYPSFNPNTPNPVEALRNRVTQETIEPGSVFKIVTMAAALERGVAHVDERIDTTGGRIDLGSSTIWDTQNYGVLTLSDVFAKSSNVGTVRVGLKLGPDTLIEYARRFGFGRRSSPHFHAEEAGKVYDPATLSNDELARVSIGYQIGVTPLQMAAAVAAIANGGLLIEPHLIRAEITNEVRTTVPRKVVHRAVTPEVAAQMTALMEGVVDHGTGVNAKVPGYTVAGKTGTAAKVIDGAYSKTYYRSSFGGFVPSRKPRFVIVVVIDSPRSRKGYYGGAVAGPIFQRIAEGALRYEGVPPTLNPQAPLLVDREGHSPREQPASGPVRALPIVPATLAQTAWDDGLVPDVVGMSGRDALVVLSRLGHKVRMRGTGLVIDQRPAAGMPIQPGATTHIRLGRPQPAVQATSFREP